MWKSRVISAGRIRSSSASLREASVGGGSPPTWPLDTAPCLSPACCRHPLSCDWLGLDCLEPCGPLARPLARALSRYLVDASGRIACALLLHRLADSSDAARLVVKTAVEAIGEALRSNVALEIFDLSRDALGTA